jgi:hypothetical protein
VSPVRQNFTVYIILTHLGKDFHSQSRVYRETSVLSGYITTLKNKQKLDVSSEGPSSRVSSHF